MGGSNFQTFLVFFLAFGLPAIGWVFGKAKEQREAKRIRDEMRKRKEELLRTGRVNDADQSAPTARAQTRTTAATPTGAQTTASAERQRLQDLAAKRQAQLRELRARQRGAQQPARSPDSAQAPAPPKQAQRPQQTTPVARGPVPSGPGTAQRVPAPGRQQPAPVVLRPTPTARPTQRPPQRSTQRPAVRPQPAESAADLIRARVQPRQEPPRPRPVSAEPRVSDDVRSMLGLTGDVSDRTRARRLKAIIAAQEVLGAPVSMRQPDA